MNSLPSPQSPPPTRLQAPNFLIIGAAGRNVGKTEFACRLIERYAPQQTVCAVKVTTVRDRNGQCPRGAKGCGVCGSLQEPFCITDESGASPAKDTGRMARAGAPRVLWLRVHADHLAAGMRALLDQIPPSAAVVCESNSAREVLDPGLFLVVREKDGEAVKPSCRNVLALADRVSEFAAGAWDLQPEEVVCEGQRWYLRQPAAAAILAGGASRRMGADKSLLPFAGVPLIEHVTRQLRPIFPEIVIGANDPAKFAFLGLPVFPDEVPGQGPLMGILSCLTQTRAELCFVTGCDIPWHNPHLINQLLQAADGYDIVMPRSSADRLEPLCAVYRKTVIGPARQILRNGGRRIVALFDQVRVRFLDLPDEQWVHNLNTPDDYQRAVRQS